MYLKRLELQGFKSFADKTVLELMPGITTVIGPNGSGKSNISDAIRWVLGEQSMKSLRGTKSLDIIFAGTQNRKSLGFAEASLVFDNSDGALPIEYTEVTVTRKIYRSGETGYYINKVPCRLKDVLELFMDTGIGKDGYSIIGQGKIDEILSNKSEDRRHIFEEAAGIVKYRTRKQESEKKLEHTKLNLLRINDILTEIEGNLEPLQMQADKAKKYLNLREELKNIEIGLFVYNIEKYKQDLEKVVQDIEIMQSQCNDEEGRLERVKILKEELKSSIDEITETIENMSNIGFESQKQIEQLNSDINVAKTRIANNNENNDRYLKEIEEQNAKIKELKDEIEQKEAKKDNLKQNKEKFEKELNEKQAELDKLTEKLSSKELEIEGYKHTVEENTDKKYELQSEINAQNINYQNFEKRQAQIKQEMQSTISELDGTRLNKEDIAKQFNEIENKKNKAQNSLNEVAKQREEANQKIKSFESNINILSSEMRIKESRLKFLIETEKEKEGYIKSVKSLLKDCENIKELGKGMNGVLANIIEVPDDLQTAIEMCLGTSLQNIVTETETDAKRLVEHLRKNNLGRASFLPISSVRGKKLDKIKGNESGVIGIASDLVKYNKKYEQIILNLLGRTVIVDNMDTAIKVAKQNGYTFRIVTTEGDLINPSGAITGGSVSKKTVNILGRGKEIEKLEKEIKNLKQKIEKLENDKQNYEESIEGILELSANLEKELQEIDITYATEKQKVISINENIEKLEKRLNRLKEEQANLEKQKEEAVSTKGDLQVEINKIVEQNEELSKIITEFAELNKDDQKYIDDLNFDITNLKISVSSFDESEASIQEIQERINQELENAHTSIENKNTQIEQIKKDNEELEKSIQETLQKIEEVKESVNSSSSKIEELKKERAQKSEKLSKQEDEITAKFKVIEDLKGQLVKLDVKKTKIEEDINGIINKMWEEYELTPNNAEQYQKPENVSLTQRRVNSLRTEIRELGSVNVDSIEEYKNLKDRYDFMSEQRLDLENTMSKLRKVISDMTQIMKEQFKEKFKVINKNFGEVFAELFGGGKAELTLEDEENILECGIDITVQPPGKKLQNMMLLSGGEKAFTAIALLFAILKINPAPFCVLDEIEAALDDVNVFRYADYLKKFTDHTQFLVITHRKGTMEVADTVYGVTMEESGISKLLSMKLKQ
ncbi:chromosome partition protein Smc [Clostridium sp. CAG:470]|nr:MAG: chromosome segregation protein SMC [Clostridium sp. 28_17]CDE14072.1 chromosome partition protein Smc [Clostridium sp. CAG:470]